MPRRSVAFRVPRALALVVILALAACSGPESRIRDGLIKAGASPKLASCMAPQMAEQLTMKQLYSLSQLGKGGEELGAREFLRRVRTMNDPQIIAITGTAAASCAIGIA